MAMISGHVLMVEVSTCIALVPCPSDASDNKPQLIKMALGTPKRGNGEAKWTGAEFGKTGRETS